MLLEQSKFVNERVIMSLFSICHSPEELISLLQNKATSHVSQSLHRKCTHSLSHLVQK